jgi:23S rRNA (guanosine2251-2'-O)-methyltransferase
MDFIYLEGRHAVLEAIRSEMNINYIMLAEGFHLPEIVKLAQERNIRIKKVSRVKMDHSSKTGRHQGTIAVISEFKYIDSEQMIVSARNKGRHPFLILTDKVTDPHNLGAIIRSAECFGADGVIIPRHRSAAINETVFRASAGSVAHMPIAQATNLVNEIEKLKKAGLWVVCADVDGEDVARVDLNMPVALIVGSEGAGVSRLVKEKCDFVVRIPVVGRLDSLNVSVAAGILMYLIGRVNAR